MILKKYKKIFPVTKKSVYLNHAAISPFSFNIIKAINEFMVKRSQNVVDVYPFVMEIKGNLKQNISKLINGKPGNIWLWH